MFVGDRSRPGEEWEGGLIQKHFSIPAAETFNLQSVAKVTDTFEKVTKNK